MVACQIWRIFTFAFLGRICGSLFVAICIALGLGSTECAAFLLSGMPILITPGIARLTFLLLASLTLFALSWRWVLQATDRSSQITRSTIANYEIHYKSERFLPSVVPAP